MNVTDELSMTVAELEAMLDGAPVAEASAPTPCDAKADDTTEILNSYYC